MDVVVDGGGLPSIVGFKLGGHFFFFFVAEMRKVSPKFSSDPHKALTTTGHTN